MSNSMLNVLTVGTSVRFEPGESKVLPTRRCLLLTLRLQVVTLAEIAGDKYVVSGNLLIDGVRCAASLCL